MSKRSLLEHRFWLSVVIPVAIASTFVGLSIIWNQDYGLTLFLFTPFLIGLVSGLIYRPRNKQEIGMAILGTTLSFVLIGFVVMAIRIEGLVCLAMAVPLALPISIVSILISYFVLRSNANQTNQFSVLTILVLSVPFLMGFEASHKRIPALHEVVTTIEVDAPIETVWKNVIEFPQINEEPYGILQLGFAYPINAKIEGTGVGAIRYCNFNTGSFVEPITEWNEPWLLAFDVAEQPPIMIETGLTGRFQTAHLDYLRSKRGQFKLSEKDGKTVIEGTTFYTHDIAPAWYWSFYSDRIIHQIHLRVLNHIKKVSEQKAN
ncbi:MAG: hypothetical protein IPL32_07440 [Chloracidobacterium sp.]|nr:hypothetical protein [Chloracidobacterium sp.]